MSKIDSNIKKSHNERAKIRKLVRELRNSLTSEAQEKASQLLSINFFQHISLPKHARIGLYLHNDGELDTSQLIQALWLESHTVFVPIIHPFNPHNLLFQKYEKNSPMTSNRYAILEPKLNCTEVAPLASLDLLLMPLVAFDLNGNRLGMGGGYYDRTLAQHYQQQRSKPKLIGLAHDCQKVSCLPVEAWDIPLQSILTPTQFYQWCD
ncbi:5-formyltetrahydrofolate cyclo-ligase [Pseudoalteromonas sp. T1lg65]|uniref:5-formyltetrahydrofolate cyclo-ligase n=1 Tax=Pseudoalteromonas sp. T1lg65 TaxID=2077101 RepID=UPI003F796826